MSRGKVKFQGKSLPEAFYNKVKEAPEAAFFGTKREGSWQYFKRSEALDFVLRSMAGLERLGFSTHDRICIYSDNREEWILTDYAAQWLRGATTSIYSTSPREEIVQILENSEPKVIFVSDELALKRLGSLKEFSSFLKAVVIWDSISKTPENLGEIPLLSREDFLKVQMDESVARGKLQAISDDDLCILLYTSGTTGEPKGVMLTQFNIVSNLRQMHSCMPLDGMQRTMSFLPLCHIYERSLHSTLLLAGVVIHFAESIDLLVENVQEVKPDIMIGVPRVFEKMYVKIHEKLKSAPVPRQLLAKVAFGVGKQTVPYRLTGESLPLPLELPYQLFDRLVFHKIRAITGGHLKFFISGGAPLSKEIAEFFFQAGITILEGYGLSETSILSVNRPGRIKFGTVGQAFDETEIRIASDGEILVRGPQVMRGYFKREDLTKECLSAEGWFATGDIGALDSEGYLRITDRKKEMIITAAGKNIAPQPIENKIKSNPLVEQVCLIGDKRKYLTALIVPNLEMSQNWARSQSQSVPESLKACQEHEALRAHIQGFLDEINEGLGSYATLKYFHLCDRPFSIEAGELTPTMKLKRRVIQEHYDKEIDAMYPSAERALA